MFLKGVSISLERTSHSIYWEDLNPQFALDNNSLLYMNEDVDNLLKRQTETERRA